MVRRPLSLRASTSNEIKSRREDTKRRKLNSSASATTQHASESTERAEKEEDEEKEERGRVEEEDREDIESKSEEDDAATRHQPLRSSASASALPSSSSSLPPAAVSLHTCSSTFPSPFIVGTAAWSIPRASAPHFPDTGSHLERYSTRLTGCEINSSFYRHHQPATYRKWAAATPSHFRFAVKLHRDFTHTQRLKVKADEVKAVIDGVKGLGDKLAVILVQLPPSLAFERSTVVTFFSAVRAAWSGVTVVEARHVSWAGDDATAVLASACIGRVVADPERLAAAPVTTSCPVVYFRLHGSPVVYKSEYTSAALDAWVTRMRTEQAAGRRVWCTFDNTALGAATENAIQVLKRVNGA